MAKISLKKVGIAGGVGVADEVAEYVDRKQAWTEPFRKATDIVRLVEVGGGLLMTAFDFMPDIGETLYTASIPLLVKSIATPVREQFGITAESVRTGRVLRPAQKEVRKPITQSEPEVPVVSGGKILA